MLRIRLVKEALLAIDVHVLAVVGPAPGCIDLDGRSRIVQDNRGIVINLGIDFRLVLLKDSVHADGSLTSQDPGRQVRSVASEIHYCASSVEDGISQPVQEFLAATYLRRALVTVVNLNPVDGSDPACICLLLDVMVRGVPGGLVVGKKENAVFPCQSFHLLGFIIGCSEGLFYHHVDPSRCAGFHDSEMLLDRSVSDNGFRTGLIQHLAKV